MITRALHDRKFRQVPHLLRLLAMKDPDEARRIAGRIVALVPDQAAQS